MEFKILAEQYDKGVDPSVSHITHFLNYCATHTDAKTKYHHSKIIFYISLGLLSLSQYKYCIHVSGYFFLSPRLTTSVKNTMPPQNISIDIKCGVMRNVLDSATEVDLGSLLINF